MAQEDVAFAARRWRTASQSLALVVLALTILLLITPLRDWRGRARGGSAYVTGSVLIVAATIIGVTSIAQLDEDIDAWGTKLPPELLAKIDAIRLEMRDPAQ